MKRILITSALIAALLITATALMACEKEPAATTAALTTAAGATNAQTTAAPVTTAPVTTAPEEKIVIATKDGCDYTIILPEDVAKSVDTKADLLASNCLKATQKKLNVRNDSTEASAKEILIGATNRAESTAAYEGIQKNEYSVKWVGEKLVVAGGSRTALIKAIEAITVYFDKNATSIEIPATLNISGTIPMDEVMDLDSGWNFLKFKAENGVNIPYQIYIPSTFSFDKEYAVILYMHSAGVKNSDGSHIKAGEAEFLRIFEKGKYKNDAIVIAPSCPEGEQWIVANGWNHVTYDFVNTTMTRYMSAALDLLAYYESELPIDTNRRYTYGMSMGGFAVWDLLARNPGMFAAAVPAAGAGDPTTVSTMGKTAIWMFHGKVDDVVPADSSYAMMDAFEAIGRTDVKFTEFPTLAHGIWSATANTEGLFDWIFSQTLAD